MIYKIAEYKIREKVLAESLEDIQVFTKAIKGNEPDTLLYEAYQKDDGVSFIHFMVFKDAKAEEAHRETEHVNRFVEVLYPLCEEEPVFTDITKIASTNDK